MLELKAPEPPADEAAVFAGVEQPDDFWALDTEAAEAEVDPGYLAALQAITGVGFPWSTIVHISVLWPDGKTGFGSGVMVGRNDVLTAGHVIYSIEHGGYAKSVSVIPNWLPQNPAARPYGESTGVPWVDPTYPAWGPEIAGNPAATRPPNNNPGYVGSELDVGMISLHRPLGDHTNWMMLWPGYQSGPLNQSGYPHPFNNVQTLLTNDRAQAATRPRDNVIEITGFETYGGNSGGPLWEMGADGRAYVAGVVSTGRDLPNGRAQGGLAFDLDMAWYNVLTNIITSNDGYILSA